MIPIRLVAFADRLLEAGLRRAAAFFRRDVAGDGRHLDARLRHGPDEVMARLARGEAVPREAYFFRTLMRFTTGAPAWAHLNKVMAIACGQREARLVLLDVYRLT